MVLKFMVCRFFSNAIVFLHTRTFFHLESRAICRYLEQKYKDKGVKLIPKEIKAQSLFEQAASMEISYFDPYASGLVSEKVFKK